MPTASVVGTFVENGFACLAVRVNENGRNVEYVGRVEITPEFQVLSSAEKKEALRLAAKAVRDAQREPAPTAPSITGSVSI